MVIAKILSVQEELLNSSIINLKINDSDQQWNVQSYHHHQIQQQYSSGNTPLDSKNLSVAELIIGTVTYMVNNNYDNNCGKFTRRYFCIQLSSIEESTELFLVSLAASDLCVATFVMPLHVVKFIAGGRWLLGMTLCHIFTTADIMLCTSSILNLCAIALDRYWAIHDPINYVHKRTLKFVCRTIAVVWLASACISVPPIIGWNDWSSESLKTHCELTTEKAFVVYSASDRSALTGGNKFSSRRTHVHRNNLQAIGNTPLVSNDNLSGIREMAITRSSHTHSSDILSNNSRFAVKTLNNETKDQTATAIRQREQISVSKEKRAAKTIAVIIFVFSFCWLPFFSAYVILPFCDTCYIHPKIMQAFVWLGYINSSLNPFLYGILNLEFRRAFEKILCPKLANFNRRIRVRHNKP
ncbi:Tyramine/octopamine receptor [Dirofilaria immitis]|nr:Tyramine/octopamine receptor [Dirofilaria immitis]